MQEKSGSTTVNQRVAELVKHFTQGNKSAFANAIGVSNQALGEIIGGRLNAPSFSFLVKLSIAFPQVRIDWVLTGAGTMLKSDSANTTSNTSEDSSTIDYMVGLEELAKELHSERIKLGIPLAAAAAACGVSEDELRDIEQGNTLLTGRILKCLDKFYLSIETSTHSSATLYPPNQNNVQAVSLLSDIPVVELGRVSFKARASFDYSQLQRFMNSDQFDTVLHRIPPGRTAEDYKDALVFDIEGDSMEPSLRDGQQVIAWPVSEGKWEYLHNTICVVDYADTVTVKAIFANDLFSKDGLTLHATGGAGGSFTVARKDIHSIWEVREFYGVVPVRLLA